MDWNEAQHLILEFLCLYLDKIEWDYGEGRAPFIYPPKLVRKKLFLNPSYYCIIYTDSPRIKSRLKIKAAYPGELVSLVKIKTSQRYGDYLHILANKNE